MADSPWTELAAELAEARKSIVAEIRGYPPPIAACDQQFNHLLEQRDRLTAELDRLAALQRNGSTPEGEAAALRAFIDTSDCIAPEVKARLADRWKLRATAEAAVAVRG